MGLMDLGQWVPLCRDRRRRRRRWWEMIVEEACGLLDLTFLFLCFLVWVERVRIIDELSRSVEMWSEMVGEFLLKPQVVESRIEKERIVMGGFYLFLKWFIFFYPCPCSPTHCFPFSFSNIHRLLLKVFRISFVSLGLFFSSFFFSYK